MNAYRKLTRMVAIGAALALAVGALTPAFAQGHSSGGGSSGGGGHSSGGYSGGGGHSSGGYSGGGGHMSSSGGRGSFNGGSHAHYAVGSGHFAPHYAGGYFGARGGFYGGNWHSGGYWHGGFYGPRFGFGWFLPVLPAFYATYYFGGIPYYYANDAYYTWNPAYNGYVATDPPAGAVDASDSTSAPPAPNAETYNYPKNGQTDEQQAADRYQCHQWAVSQSGYDPTRTNAPTAGGQQTDYHRALTACLEGRGYSVR
jgi:hypothetical protein